MALLVVHDDLFVLDGTVIGQDQRQLFTLFLADEQIQPAVLQDLLLVVAGQQYGGRVDAGDGEVGFHAADEHVGRVDQGGGEVPLLLQLFRRLMACRKLVVQPCSHLVEGGDQGIQLVGFLAGQGAPLQRQLYGQSIQIEFLGIVGDAVEVTDHQIVNDDQDAERDHQRLDGLADHDEHGFFNQALVDLFEGGGDEQLADHFTLIGEIELAGDVVAFTLYPLGQQRHFRVAEHLLDHHELHVGQVHDAFYLYLDLLLIQVPQAGGDGLQEGGLDLADAVLDDGDILAVIPGKLQHRNDHRQYGTAHQNVGEQAV